MACLGDDTIAALLEGGLSAEHARAARLHLADCTECRQLVGAAIDRPTAREVGAATLRGAPPIALQPGAVVAGDYRIVRLVGEGGMGRVFEAEQRGLDRHVALKVLLPELARDPVALARFHREARLVAQLSSVHVVRVHDLGVADGGAPYLVMELLDGEDLATIVARGPVPIDQAVRWILDACEALGEAHALGIVHRDLKPSNLFVTRQGRLVVLDFGLAKLTAASGATTADGIVLGSPRYMAPEQITGARDVDARADIWALGATLYHLVTGIAPFREPTIEGLFARILSGVAPALDGVPPALAAVIARAMAREPALRYATAGELAAALRTPPSGLAQRFEIHELLGEGSHGAVYRARPRLGGRDVALKVLRGVGSRDRFAREAAIVQRLEHPNTVRLHDAGVADDGTPYMAFELVRGRTLASELARGPLLPARVVRIATQTLKALGEAHALGVVHRDVTPSNILLVDFIGDPDFVKLLDFGVASDAESPRLTHTGQTLGTPRYMAPEQVMGRPIDARTDLYALGLVLAEALTGRPVFETESALAACFQNASTEPVPLPRAVLDGPLGEVIAKATQKRPEDRFASAAEMLAMVERGPVAVRPGRRRAPATDVVARRNRMAPAIVLTIVGSVAVTAGVLAWHPWSREAPAQAAAAPTASPTASPTVGSAPQLEPPPPKPASSASGVLTNVDEDRLRRRAEKLGWTVRETRKEQFPGCDHTTLQLQRGELSKQTYRWADITLQDCVSEAEVARVIGLLRRGFRNSWFVPDGNRLLMVSTDDPDAPGEQGSKRLTELLLSP
ncbi:MAG TPA: protein kinase [Kofleriaceae bacterium]|nr:protein kinase [Kofleriaceae bacterium]